jgi:enterochelin esterase-like enzyme
MHEILNGKGIDHQWHVYPGIHGGTYWQEHLVDYMRFFGMALSQQ